MCGRRRLAQVTRLFASFRSVLPSFVRSSCLNCSPRGGLETHVRTHAYTHLSTSGLYHFSFIIERIPLRPSYCLTYVNALAPVFLSLSPSSLRSSFATWTYGGCLWLTLRSARHKHSEGRPLVYARRILVWHVLLIYSKYESAPWCFLTFFYILFRQLYM